MPAQPHRRSILFALLACTFWLTVPHLSAQERESGLSDAEIEKLRDTAYVPPDRILAFIAFLDQRTSAIDKLSTGKRRPGREEDIHDLMEQFTSIADDLDDNLDDYAARHQDIRKSLPRLVSALEHWGTALKSPPDHAAYNVSRQLALEAVADLHEAATRLIEEQRLYFLAHPPAKEPSRTRPQANLDMFRVFHRIQC